VERRAKGSGKCRYTLNGFPLALDLALNLNLALDQVDEIMFGFGIKSKSKSKNKGTINGIFGIPSSELEQIFRRKPMAVSKELLDILACPKCKGPIELNDKGNGLICNHCKLLYEIRDDIPIMLIDEAKPITP
jgi:hypothetical protein